MAQSSRELHILAEISVNNEGTAEGWTPSLPAAVFDNDTFEIVTDYPVMVSSITRAAAIATVVTTGNHYLPSNAEITITGAVQTEYNGTFPITKIDDTSFSYTVPGTPVSPATGTLSATLYGDYIRPKSGVGYVPALNYEIQTQWVKSGFPTTIETHDLNIGDTGVSGMSNGGNYLQVAANTLPSNPAGQDFELRFSVWLPVGEPSTIYYNIIYSTQGGNNYRLGWTAAG
jgi:hypothetical protein